jgi:succinate dehydrogenase flavin-adding protein (antitoxin of CptAB toxin-antitoxin module)
LFIKDSSLYNYADDNTLSFGSPDFDQLISTLESDSNHLIEWFKINKMQANPDKFQVLAVGKSTKMPGQRAKVKITKNKSMENCKFV